MAAKDYFSHDAPDGDNFEDRYRQHGYTCKVYTSSNRYLVGAENIAYTYAAQDVRTERGTLVNHRGNETSIARGLVRGWMNSTGHRENILTPDWETEGIGVAIASTSQGKRVYVTQNFC